MGGNGISRRDFLKVSSLTLAGACAALKSSPSYAGMMGGGGGMGGGGMGGGCGTGTIDPPPGSSFQDPPVMPNISTTPGVVEVAVNARKAPAGVNGTTANLLTYNGFYPAPTIRARQGDLLRIRFTNSLDIPGTN
ncbi:MAG: multicopper oxidase domain-containing protein, partial [Deltaproteobacteria bacterium]|nr:multicopper oxidase domain-containing protein [Deltaproteobacteria bacterium]